MPTVYEKDNCRACVNTKRKLTELGIQYEVADLTEPGNLAAAKDLGHLQAPVVVWGTKHWSGYRPDRIQELVDRLNNKEENE